jgi:hypothetical protein
MKLPSILFAASLALNGALLVFLASSPQGRSSLSALFPGSAASSSSSSSSSKSASAPSSTSPSAASSSSPEALAAALKSGDHATLRDQLRALGLSEGTVQNVMRAILWQPYLDRQLAINAAKASSDQPYWRGLQQTGRRAYTREERAELRELASSLRGQILDVLGPQGFDATSPYSQRYAFLSPESAAKIVDLDRDYSEMRQEINQESERFKVASDADKLKFLEQERRKDLETTLTPAELEEYNLRFSPAAYTLRNRLSKIDLTETEYRDLYDLQQAFYNNQPDTALARPLANQKLTPEQIAQLQTRAKDYEALNQEMRQTLGEERYAQYQRASDNDYRQLQAAADRFNLPTDTIDQVYGYRDATAVATQRIAADPALTPEQKKQALATLASQTRRQISTALGDEVATAYLDRNMKWLERVQAGNVLTIAPNTNRLSYKPVAPRPATPKTPRPDTAPERIEVEKR